MKMKVSGLLTLAIAFTASWSWAAPGSSPAGFNCPQYRFEKREFSFAGLNPAAENYNSIALPATGQTLYRGAYEANGQFDFAISMRGLFNEANWFVGSPLHWGLSQVLKKAWDINAPFLPNGGLPYTLSAYFQSRGILGDVQTLMSCAPAKGYSQTAANILAADLMNKAFAAMGKDNFENNFLNISNPVYYRADFQAQGFGNNAVDFIISSAYDQVAAVYGKKILVMKDTRKRAVDLGFWNKKHNDVFWHHWVDNGEINTPGYITADELLGYQSRKTDRPQVGWGGYYANLIDYAIYRHKIGSQNVVLLLDGQNSACMTKGDDSRYYVCEQNWGNITSDVVPYPTTATKNYKTQIGLIGVFVLCDAGQKCTIPESFWNDYGKTVTRPLPIEAKKFLAAATTVDGKEVQFIPSGQTVAPANAFEGIKVISATFGKPGAKKSNVAKKAAEFLNGNTEMEYKVSSKFLGLTYEDGREFELKWICPKDPKDVQSVKIDAPAEGKKFTVKCED
jgi:hypothetical protein